MNVKIKADGVFCSFEKIYEQLYTGLYHNMSSTTEWLFTERKVGTGYLQWELPGEGWYQLSKADPLMQQEIKHILHNRKLSIIKKGILDDNLIHQILATPDDSFVYFRKADNGNWEIKLTAWGYCYPVRIKTSAISGLVDQEVLKQEIKLRMCYDGKPLSNKKFLLNEFERYTNENGEFDIVGLPVGYEFDVNVDGQKRHVIICQGKSLEEFDFTQWCNITVNATLNGQPYSDATAHLYYGEKQFILKLDASGSAQERIALSQNNASCEVRIDDASESKTLVCGTNTFNFAITKVITPPIVDVIANVKVTLDENPCVKKEVEIKYDGKLYHLYTDDSGHASISLQQNLENNQCEIICDDKTITKSLQAPETQFTFDFKTKIIEKKIWVKAKLNNEAYKDAHVTIECEGKSYQLITDTLGEAETTIQTTKDYASCKVTCEEKEQTKQLADETTLFAFEFQEEEETIDSEVVVTVVEKETPRKDMTVTINYGGKTYTLTTDGNGKARIFLPITNKEEHCYTKVLECTLHKKLELPQTFFDFEIVEKTPWWMYILGFLGILLFILLALFTYFICGGMLFA